MKTVFVCHSINLRVEGLDNRPYTEGERITLKHQGRWLPMIVEDVREEGLVRQVVLRLNRTPDSVFLKREVYRDLDGGSAAAPRRDSNWLMRMIEAIEGGSGPVVW